MSKSLSPTIAAAAANIAASIGEPFDPLAMTVNITEYATEEACESGAMATAVALMGAGSRFNEQTIVAKRNVGLLIFRAAKIRCESTVGADKPTVMPDVKVATIGKLGKILGLTDTPAKNERSCEERFGYKRETLGACVDLARGVIADVDDAARAAIRAEGSSVTERNLRSAILAEINPDAARNRSAGADAMAAAKIAAAAGRKAGALVKVKSADGTERTVKVDAEKLTAVKNDIAASLLTEAAIAAASDAQIAATIKALQLVKAARESGAVKAPKAKAPAKA